MRSAELASLTAVLNATRCYHPSLGARPPLQITAPFVLPVDKVQIPTGEVAPVAGTGFDFTTPTPVGKHIMEIDGA